MVTIPSLKTPIKPQFGHISTTGVWLFKYFWGTWGNEEGAGIIRDETWAAWTGWQSTSSKDQLPPDQLRVDLVRVDLVRVDLVTPSPCTIVKIPTKTDSPPFLSLVFALLVVSLNGSVEGHFQLTLVEASRQCTYCTHTLLSACMYILIACSTLHLAVRHFVVRCSLLSCGDMCLTTHEYGSWVPASFASVVLAGDARESDQCFGS